MALCTLISTLVIHCMHLAASKWPTPILSAGRHRPYQVPRIHSHGHKLQGRGSFTHLRPPNVSEEEVQSLLRAPLVNSHNYQFVSLPKVKCQGRLVIAVTSEPSHTHLRDAIRRTWGKWANIPSSNTDYEIKLEEDLSAYDGDTYDVSETDLISTDSGNGNFSSQREHHQQSSGNDSFTLVFFVGGVVGEDPASTSLRLKLLRESQQHGDMVISSFTDTFSNLSLKTVSILKWVDTFCPASRRFFVKCEDDSYINVPVMLRTLEDTDEQPRDNFGRHFIVGYPIFGAKPDRHSHSKYYVSFADFRGRIYPPVVSGTAYGMRMDTAKLLYQVSVRTRLFLLENIYIVGICGGRVGVHVVADPRFTLSTHLFSCKQGRLASGHSYRPSEMHRVHSHLTNSKLCPPPPPATGGLSDGDSRSKQRDRDWDW